MWENINVKRAAYLFIVSNEDFNKTFVKIIKGKRSLLESH